VFNIFVVLFGVAIGVFVFSVLTAFIVEGELHDVFRRGRMNKQINALSDHFIVCGLGETGRYVVEELLKMNTPHVIIENSQEVVDRLRNQPAGLFGGMLYIVGDATDENVLREAGLDRARGIVSALDSDKDNLVITIMVRQLNPRIRIVSRHADLSFAERMIKAGANATVSPNRIGGLRLASELLRPQVVEFLDLMIQQKSGTFRFEEIPIEKGSPWLGSALGSLELRSKFDLVLLALKNVQSSGKDALRINPPDDTVLSQGATIIVMGDRDALGRARIAAQGQAAPRVN